MQNHPINFPYLVERFSLLVIIIFGEMIIGIAPYFTVTTIGFQSLLVLLIVCFLFLFYIVEMDHLIDHKRENESGFKFIYWHYPIFVGLTFVTVSLGFFREEDVNTLFLVEFLYTGLILFYGSILAQKDYNKIQYRYPKSFVISQSAVFLAGLILSLCLNANKEFVLIITTVVVTTLAVRYIRFNLSKL